MIEKYYALEQFDNCFLHTNLVCVCEAGFEGDPNIGCIDVCIYFMKLIQDNRDFIWKELKMQLFGRRTSAENSPALAVLTPLASTPLEVTNVKLIETFVALLVTVRHR